MIIEWLDENSGRAYPFQDNIDTSPLPDDVIVDALIATSNRGVCFAALTSFSNVDGNVTLSVDLYDSTHTDLHSYTFSVSATPYELNTYITDVSWQNNIDFSIKLIFGKGITSFTGEYSGLNIAFCDAVLVPAMPRVTAVQFATTNIGSVGYPFTYPTTVVPWYIGSNILFEKPSYLSVFPGAGSGLYNDCNKYAGAVKTINNLGPANGNFNIGGDSCYVKTYGENSLQLSNICSSPCPSEYFDAIAHYTNRIVDAESTVVTSTGSGESSGVYGVNHLTDNLTTLFNCYSYTMGTYRPPVVCEIMTTPSPIANGNYWSFLIIAYNTIDSALDISIEITLEGGASEPADPYLWPVLTTLPLESHTEGTYNVTIKAPTAGTPTAQFDIKNSSTDASYYSKLFYLN